MRRIRATVIHLVIAVTAIVVTIATVIRQVIAVTAIVVTIATVIRQVIAVTAIVVTIATVIRRAIFAIQVARHAIGVIGAINASIMTRALPATAILAKSATLSAFAIHLEMCAHATLSVIARLAKDATVHAITAIRASFAIISIRIAACATATRAT